MAIIITIQRGSEIIFPLEIHSIYFLLLEWILGTKHKSIFEINVFPNDTLLIYVPDNLLTSITHGHSSSCGELTVKTEHNAVSWVQGQGGGTKGRRKLH